MEFTINGLVKEFVRNKIGVLSGVRIDYVGGSAYCGFAGKFGEVKELAPGTSVKGVGVVTLSKFGTGFQLMKLEVAVAK